MINDSYSLNRLQVVRKPGLSFKAALAIGIGLIFPISGQAQAPTSAVEWYQRASELYQDGAVDEAIGSLQEALKLNKDYPEALSLLGSAYVESGEFAKAVEPYRHASELKPNDYSILVGYANALEGANKKEEELPVQKKLFSLNKSDMVTGIKYLTLIEADGREKHVDDYIALLEDLRKLPNFDASYTAKLARAYNKTGNFPKAAEAFAELIKGSPESSEYWAGLAASQAHFDKNAAKESYKKAILYTEQAEERGRLESAMAALGSAPVKTVPVPEAPVTSTPVASTPVVAAPVIPSPDLAQAKAKADAEAAAQAKSNAEAQAAEERRVAADKKVRAEADQKAAANLKAALDKKNADLAAAAAADAKSKMEAEKAAKAEENRLAQENAKLQAKAHADSLAQAHAEKKALDEANAKAKAEAMRLTKEEAARKAKEHQDSLVQAQASKQAIEAANQQAKAEAMRLAKEEATRKAKAHADSLAQAQAEKKALDEANAKAKAEAFRIAKEEAARKAKERQDSLVQAQASKQAIEAANQQAKAEAMRLAKEEAARKAKAHADSLAQAQAEKKALDEANAKAKAEAMRLAKEEAARKAKAHADSLAQAQAEKKALDEANAKAKAEAFRIAKEEAARKAKERQDSLVQAQASKQAIEAANQQAKAEAMRLAKEEAARKAKAHADSLAQAQAEKKALEEANAKAKAEAMRLAKEEATRKAKAHADSLAQAQAEKKALDEANVKAKAEAMRLAKEEAARKAKAHADSLAQAQAEKKALDEANAKTKAEAMRLAKEDAARKAKAHADSLAQAQAEKKALDEANAKAKAEAMRLAKEEAARKAKAHADSLAQAQAEKKALDEANAKAKAEAMRLAKEEAARKAKAHADSLAQAQAEKKALDEANAKAKAEAMRLAKEEAARQAKIRADSIAQAKLIAENEHKAKLEAERKAKEVAARLAREEADRRAKARADSLVRVEEERKAAAELARKAKEEALRLAKIEADRKAKERLDSLARVETERKAKAEAERISREEAAKLAREEADRKAKAEAERLAQLEAERKAKAEEEKQFQDRLTALITQQPSKMDTAAMLVDITERRAKSKVPDPRLIEAEAVINFMQWDFRPAVANFGKLKVLSPTANRMMALALFEVQDYSGSLKYFQKMPNVTANRVDWNKYIKTLLQTKQRAKAALEYEAYLLKYPDAEDALSFLVEFYRQPLQKDKLIPKLEMQLAKNPKDAPLLLELIGLYDKSSPKSIEYRVRYLKITPEDSKQTLALAQAYETKGNTLEALKLYQQLAKETPTDKNLNLKTADLLYANKQSSNAIPYLEQAHISDNKDKNLSLRLAGAYEELKKLDQAAEVYSQILEANPKDKAMQAKLFTLYSAKGDKAQLQSLLMKIEESDPTSHQAQFQLAKLLLESGDKEKAYVYLEKALRNQPANAEYLALLPFLVTSDEQVDGHFAALEKSALLPAAKPELQAMIARGYAKRKNNLMAARLYSEAYAKNPKLVEGQREAVEALYIAKNFELSGALAEKYLLTDDRDKGIHEILVNSFVNTKKSPDKIRRAIQGLAAMDPDGGSKWSMRLAELDIAALDTNAAIGHAKDWLSKNPKNVEGWRFLAPLVAKRDGQEDTYIQVLQQLGQLEPANRAKYDLELGNLFMAKGNFEDAEKSLLSASKSNPANAMLWYRLGEAQVKLRKEKDAVEKFHRAYQLDSKNITFARTFAQYMDSKDEIKLNLPLFLLLSQNGPSVEERKKLAKAYYLTGDYANSAKEWDWVLKGEPALASTEPMIADAYMRSGQSSKARGLYEQRLLQDPNNLAVLESIAGIYKSDANQAGYLATVEKIVGVDPAFKVYQVTLAAEKEKAKNYRAALDLYTSWVSRNPGDLTSLKAMHRLADQQKDTTLLMDALVRLNREKTIDNTYKYQLAEIDFRRSGNIIGVEKLVTLHPDYKQGKAILVREYIRTNAKTKLIPLSGFLVVESKTDKTLLEPLADLYAMQKKTMLANTAYHDLLIANPKSKEVYTKVYTYSAANGSPYLSDILRIGYESFPQEMDIKRAYAATLGKTPKALEIYQEVLVKEPDVKVIARALDIAMTLKQVPVAALLLDKWINLEPKEPKVWEQALAVHTQMSNKQRMADDLEQLVRFYPQRKDLTLQLANLYEEQKQLDKATGMYQKTLALDGKNQVVQGKVVTLLTSQNRIPELRQVLLTIDKNDPAAHDAQFRLASMFLEEKDREQAYTYITKALRNQPQNPEYKAMLPRTIVTDQQVMDNFIALEKLAAVPGARPELQMLVGRGYAKKKNSLMAARYFTEVYAKSPKLLEGNRDAVVSLYDAKSFELSGSLAEKYLAADPLNSKDKTISEILVNSFSATKKPADKMREAIRNHIAIDPESATKWNMRLAELDLAVRDTAGAIVHVCQWLEKNPKDANSWHFLMPLVTKRPGQEDVYIQVLEKLVLLEPAMRGRYDFELGSLYFDKGNYEDAEVSFTNAAKGSASNAKIWYRLGETELKLRKDKESVDKFHHAYQLEPGNITYARAYSRNVSSKDEIKQNLPLLKFLNQSGPSVEERKKLAQAYFLNLDYSNSAKEWDWLLKTDSTLGATEPMVSDAYMLSGQKSKARGLYERRLLTEPNNLALLESVANLYKLEANQKGYVSTLQRIVLVDPKYKGYQLLLASELEKAKDLKGALQQYADWIGRNGDDESALKAMHRLADQQKDTATLMDALVRLNRNKKVDLIYAFQLAEVDYVRSGNIAGIEKLVAIHPDFRRGKVILIKSYYQKGAVAKMAPFVGFLAQEAKLDPGLAEPLGDVYAFQNKSGLANESYFEAARMAKKDRKLFVKVYKYAKEHDSPYRAGLLKQGYEAFSDDVELKGDYALTLGKTPKALDLFNEILVKDHNNLPALRNGSEIAVSMNNTEMATGLLQRWVALEPEQVRPWTLLVDLYTVTKNNTKLAEALGHVSELNPKNGEIAYKAALAYTKIGNKEKSLDLLTKAVTLSSANPIYQKEFGLALVAAGQAAKAKNPLLIADRTFKNDEAINMALYNIYLTEKNQGLARERLRTLVSLKPSDKALSFSLARLESELKSPADAVRILERPIFKDVLDAEMSFLLLDGYFKLGQKDRAAALGPQLIRKYPEEAKQSLPLAVLFYETKNKSKAKEILESYTRNHPVEEAFYYLGKIYFEEKNWQGTINNLTRADEKRVDVLSMLGQAYIANKEPEQAIKVYEGYYAKTKDIKILVELYNLYKKTNDEKGTLAMLERLMATEPQNFEYRVELAEIYRAHGDIKKAEVQYDMILKKMPSLPSANMNLGMILAGRKEYSRAIKLLEIGLAKFPDSSTGWRYLGDAYRNDKRYASSLQAYKRAFKLQDQSLPIAISKMQMTKEVNATSELMGAYADVVRLDSGNVEATSALADIYFAERKYVEATTLYTRVTANKNVDKAIWANFGYALLETKQISGAKKAFQRAVDLGENSPRVMTSLARIYKEEGNVDKAESILSAMVKKDPRNHMAYFWLGQIAAERNQPGVAEGYFHKAQLLAPANGDYAEALARMNYNKDEFAEASRLLEPVKENLSSAGRLMYGDCLMKQGRNADALVEFNALFSKSPSAPVLAKLAELQINKGNYREAIHTIESSDFSQDSLVLFSLAKARLASHEVPKAREVLERLIRDSKYNPNYYHYRGLTYFEEKDYTKAKKDFDQAIKYNPDLMDAVYHIGLCLLNENSNTDAKNYFKELSQHANPANQAKGFLGLAMAFYSEKKFEAAENFLQKSVSADESADAECLWARVLLKLRKPNEAEKHAAKALELQPGNSKAVVAMGDVLLAQNKKSDALVLAKRALEGNPNSCELLIGSAKINFAAGNYETSKSNSTYAISICPDDASPYYFAGVVADKKYQKKEAKDFFKAFRKHGGDEAMLPPDYR